MRLGLQSRYALILVALTISIVALVGGALLFQFRTTSVEMRHSGRAVTQAALMSQVDKDARGMAAYLAENLTNPMYRLDVDRIKDLVGSAAAQKGVNYVFVFDAARRVLHDGTDILENYGRLLDDDVTLRALQADAISSAVHEDSLDVVAPVKIGSQLLGGVKVSRSLTAARADIAELQGTLASISAVGTRNYLVAAGMIGGVFILLSLLLSIQIARRLTQPIETLSGLTGRIGRGQYEIDVPFERSDEIGELALSMQRMSRDLKETTVSKDYVDNILQNMLDPLLVFARNATVQSANAAACRALGRELPDLVGRHVGEILCEDSVRNAAIYFNESDCRNPISVEGRLLHQDGACIPALISWSTLAEAPGHERQVLCVARDITERKLAEEALKASEERFRALMANSPAAIFLNDVDGRFVFVNRRFEDWYGISETQAYGKTVQDLLPAAMASLYAAEDRHVLETGKPGECELDVQFTDAKLHSIITTKFPVFGTDGSVIGIGTINTDVTEQRKAEENLRQAQKMEVIGQLTGGVAHDFNNLLTVIIGNAELVQDRLGKDDQPTQSVMHAAFRGAELTQRMLAFSRRQPLRPQNISLENLVMGLQDMLSRTLGETIEVAISSAPGLWQAVADPAQVESALLNLAVNARHAMPEGGRLTIQARNVSLDAEYAAAQDEVKVGDYVLLAVRDTGCGMAPDVTAHAFEPFFTTKDVGEGSGLGLSMVYGFAKQSGGHASIHSQQGHGTTVNLYLPRASATLERREEHRHASVPRGHDEVVLVIEDDPDVRGLTVRMAKGLGYRVIDVPDAAGARDFLAQGMPIDLVLSDVVLPGGTSGPEFMNEIRDTQPDLKVIFMSGYPADAARHRGLLNPDGMLLSKPFQKRQLAMALRQALD